MGFGLSAGKLDPCLIKYGTIKQTNGKNNTGRRLNMNKNTKQNKTFQSEQKKEYTFW